jgi:uncharacterized membrane protein
MQLIRALSPVPFFMVWNSVLAAVPLVLAWALFRRGIRAAGPIWWLGLVAFMVTLPNAPYVLTDLVHLIESAHHGVLLRTAIAYVAFVSFGMFAYTVSVARFTRHLRRIGVSLGAALAAEVALHGVVAVGVLIGRYGRWNSWDLGLRPVSVVADSIGYMSPRAVVAVALLAVGIGVIAATLRLALLGVMELAGAREA